jgi:hypothetical protein
MRDSARTGVTLEFSSAPWRMSAVGDGHRLGAVAQAETGCRRPSRRRAGRCRRPPAGGRGRRPRRGDRAVAADGDADVVGLEGDGAALAEDQVALLGDELVLGVELEGAVAGVALALGRLHHEEAAAVDGDVERIAGLGDAALGQVGGGRAVPDEGHATVGPALERIVPRDRHQVLLEDNVVLLEPRGVQVGEVVGDDIELTLQGDLPRETDETNVLHRTSPFVSASPTVSPKTIFRSGAPHRSP